MLATLKIEQKLNAHGAKIKQIWKDSLANMGGKLANMQRQFNKHRGEIKQTWNNNLMKIKQTLNKNLTYMEQK